MTTYRVTITGNQKHIKGEVFENQTLAQVELIIDKFHDVDYPKPKIDGNNWELNNDKNICITDEYYKI